jgi:F-type H+-transporting ATPase subunit epsilon
MAGSFKCTLITPERQVFDESIAYANIPAWDGSIGILIHRAPLVTELGEGILEIELASGGSRFYFIAGGFAQMKPEGLVILTTECIASDEVKKADAEKLLRDAEAKSPVTTEEFAAKLKAQNRAKALLEIAGKTGKAA